MRIPLLCCFLLIGGTALTAQNFYVAFVKGEVYWRDSLLQPRTKLQLDGEFRFSTPEDYLRVIGPTGMHRIAPVERKEGGYEFIRAVRQELFPAPSDERSYVMGVHSIPNDYLNLEGNPSTGTEVFMSEVPYYLRTFDPNHPKRAQYYVLRREKMRRQSYSAVRDPSRLFMLLKSASGAAELAPAPLRLDSLYFTTKDLTEQQTQQPYHYVNFVHAYDTTALRELLSAEMPYDTLWHYLEYFMGDNPQPAERFYFFHSVVNAPDVAPKLHRTRAPGIVLGGFDPRRMVDRAEVFAELDFYRGAYGLTIPELFTDGDHPIEVQTFLTDRFGQLPWTEVWRTYRTEHGYAPR